MNTGGGEPGDGVSSCRAVELSGRPGARQNDVKSQDCLVIAATVKMADRSSGWLKKKKKHLDGHGVARWSSPTFPGRQRAGVGSNVAAEGSECI